MLAEPDGEEKKRAQYSLSVKVRAGSVGINILTKLDRENYQSGQKLPGEFSDAMSALRGFANSEFDSSVVFSAGLNLHLYSYAEKFPDFYADENRCGTTRA